MTRFARAKGSKASNERTPEEATSWREMKQQLMNAKKEVEESTKRKEVANQRNANYQAFLDEKEEEQRTQTKWADFPGNSEPKQKVLQEKGKGKGTLKNLNKSVSPDSEAPTQLETINVGKEQNTVMVTNDLSDSDAPPEELSAKQEVKEPIVKVKKIKKKPLKIKVNKDKRQEELTGKHEKGAKRKLKISKDGEISTKKLKSENNNMEKKEQKKVVNENLTETDLKKIEKKKKKRLKQLEKKKKMKVELKTQKEEEMKTPQVNGDANELQSNVINSNKNNFVSKLPTNKPHTLNKHKKQIGKARDDKEHSRKKPFLPHKMFINGKELEVDYVDGFPVKKEDAERLKKLRGQMISKGLPRSEINTALKLERRKAEKALAREKKKVCFNCRKSGHNLSECPELNKDQVAQTSGSGICFKCGSTEHTHFECKVVRGQEFKFAQCFICNEQGHIARQCPDNARGLYPKGGGCKVCGDVTHLKKDCPKYQAQQQNQESDVRVETFGDSNPDALEANSGRNHGKVENKQQNKIIKF